MNSKIKESERLTATDLSKSYMHERPAPTTEAPTIRPVQTDRCIFYLLEEELKNRIQEQLCVLSNMDLEDVDNREVQELIGILDDGLETT